METGIIASLSALGACIAGLIAKIQQLRGVFRSRCFGRNCCRFEHEQENKNEENRETS
jgi:hypothetical protein